MPRGAAFLRAGSSTGRKVEEGAGGLLENRLSSPLGACSGTIFFWRGRRFFHGVYLVFEHLLIISMAKPITSL